MAVHLGFPKKTPKLNIGQVPLGKIGGEPLWLFDNFSPSCCGIPSLFILQVLAPGEDLFSYYRYLYIFQCPGCKSPSVYRGQLSKENPYFSEEEQKIPIEDDWNAETTNEAIEELLETPDTIAEFCDVAVEIFEEDSKVTEVIKRLFKVDLRNQLEIGDLIEFMEGGVESNSEEKMSQEDDDDDEDFDDFAEDIASRDVSFEVFRWFHGFHAKSPVVRYGKNMIPLWYSDKNRPILSPNPCHCGKIRVLECQILPQVIASIPGYDLDFGEIFIYTCPNSCMIQGYVAEEAFYQPSL